MSNAINSMNTNVDGQNLVIEQIFDAPRELVFEAFKEPKLLERWWRPNNWST